MANLYEILPIRRLSSSVINQIAAGEVIERPASVVKELIENSLDADASEVHIVIEKGGTSLISVQDNGHGIQKNDMSLVLARHATSKITQIDDLQKTLSLGFRGEALASIASVSSMQIVSRARNAEQAWMIELDVANTPAAHPVGSTIYVRDLFFSVPARKKFLKSERTEWLHIQTLIRALALSYFSTTFYVQHNDKKMMALPSIKQDFDERISMLYGRKFLEHCYRIDEQRADMHLWGWLGHESQARSHTDRQFFYVNGRNVRDKHVNHAIRIAVADRLYTGRYPVFVLHLQMPPHLLDVNVHPSKQEVRFANLRAVHDFIYDAIKTNLAKSQLAFNTDDAKEELAYQTPSTPKDLSHQADLAHQLVNEHQQISIHDQPLTYITLTNERHLVIKWQGTDWLLDFPKTRILLSSQRLVKHYTDQCMRKRPILVPLNVAVKAHEIQWVEQHQDAIQRWGFEFDPIGNTQLALRALPAILEYADAIKLVHTFLEHIMNDCCVATMAKAVAEHVDDAGGYTPSIQQMVAIMQQIVAMEADNGEQPWCRLDSAHICRLLTK